MSTSSRAPASAAMRPAWLAVRCPYSRASDASVSANVDSQTSMSAWSASANAASHSRVSMMNAKRWPRLGSLTSSRVTGRPSATRLPSRCSRPMSGPVMPSAASRSGSIRRPSGSSSRYPKVGALCDSGRASSRNAAAAASMVAAAAEPSGTTGHSRRLSTSRNSAACRSRSKTGWLCPG